MKLLFTTIVITWIKFETDLYAYKMDLDAYESYEIFVESVRFPKTIKVFERSIIRYIDKPRSQQISKRLVTSIHVLGFSNVTVRIATKLLVTLLIKKFPITHVTYR